MSAEALAHAAAVLQLALPAEVRRSFLETAVRLPAWPEAASVLKELGASGRKLAFLSNFTPRMLASAALPPPPLPRVRGSRVWWVH